LSSHL